MMFRTILARAIRAGRDPCRDSGTRTRANRTNFRYGDGRLEESGRRRAGLVSAVGLSAESGADGKYTVTGVPAGTYQVRVYRLGFKAKTMTGVTVTAGQSASLAVSLEAAMVQLGGVVVSASRRVEKVTDAPAAITTIDAHALEGRSATRSRRR